MTGKLADFFIFMKRFLLTGIAALFATIPAWANPLPLDTRADWSSVVDAAHWQANNDRPIRLSAPTSTPEYVTYSGTWTPTQNMMRLAIFSDDGCDVWIDGQKVWSRKGQGQALPNLSQSLHVLPGTFVSNQTYTIQIDYSNTAYLGSADIDGVTLFAYRDGKREWQASEGNEGKIGQGRSTQGNWVDNGRLKAPFDQRTSQTQTVKVGPGGRLGFEIEAATDYDLWKDKDQNGSVGDSGVWQDEIVSYTWKCSAGKFVVTGSDGQEQLVDTVTGEEALTATWVAWSVSSPPQTVRVWCEIADEGPAVPSGETGSRDDEKLVREQSVVVVPVQLLVQRQESSKIASTITVAAGGVNSPEQKASVHIIRNDGESSALPIGDLYISNEMNDTGFQIKANLQRKSHLEWNFASGDYIDTLVRVKLKSGGSEPYASIRQMWNESADWGDTNYFDYDTDTVINFQPRFMDDTVPIPIRSQSVAFSIKKITALVWDRKNSQYEEKVLSPNTTGWRRVKNLVTITDVCSDSGSGWYKPTLNVKWDPDFTIDEVEIYASSRSVWEK